MRRAYVGVSWATKPTCASWAGSTAGGRPSTVTVPAVGVSRPTARCSSVVLPAPIGTDQSDHVAGGDLEVAVVEGPASAVPLAQTLGVDDPAHAMSSSAVERKESRNSASMLSSSSPARRALTIQRCRA